MLSDILSGQSELRGLLDSIATSNRETPAAFPRISATPRDRRNLPILGIKVSTHQNQRSPCLPHCGCKCHEVHSFKTPRLMHEFIGTLFFGYSGCPVGIMQKCSVPECISSSTSRAYCHYLFPLWFLTKALTLTAMATFRTKILISLTVRPTVDPGSEVIRFVSSDDVEGLRTIFCRNSISPDMIEYISGQSLLSVGYTHH